MASGWRTGFSLAPMSPSATTPPRDPSGIRRPFARTVVGEGASIGANATLLPGIEIGRYALIGAGSVVTRNVPAFALWVGNPARPRGFVTRDGTVLDLHLNDKAGQAYVLVDGEPVRND
jgi:UDP-2-acetamido-3-amino-2,3-dideoxy-glucuronate N-acetyltransferase